jgi:hypothetical protein
MNGRRNVGRDWGALAIGIAVAIAASGMATTGRAGVPLAMPVDGVARRLGFGTEDVGLLPSGRAAARPLDVQADSELSAEGVVLLEAPVDVVVEAFRDLSILQRAGLTEASGKFSAEPSIQDLAPLQIPASDVAQLAKARAGNADVKLSGAELTALGSRGEVAIADAYKLALVRRIMLWKQQGLAGLGVYHDKKRPVCQKEATTRLLDRIRANAAGEPMKEVDSFQYWAVERIGDFKPLVQLTHVSIHRGPSGARIETVQLYASHYCDALVTSVELVPVTTNGVDATLMRLTFRAEMDSLGGVLGGLKRKIGRSRVVEHVAAGLERIRAAVS